MKVWNKEALCMQEGKYLSVESKLYDDMVKEASRRPIAESEECKQFYLCRD